MQWLEDARPVVPEFDDEASAEIQSMARAARLESARSARKRGVVLAGTGLGALALTAGAVAVAAGTFGLSLDGRGETVWIGTLPSGIMCTAEGLDFADEANSLDPEMLAQVDDAELEPYREAVSQIIADGLEVTEADIAETQEWFHSGQVIFDQDQFAAMPTGQYDLVANGDGTYRFEYSKPLVYFEYTGDDSDVADDGAGGSMVGYIKFDMADSEPLGGVSFSTPAQLDHGFWAVSGEGTEVYVRPATDEDIAAYALRWFGSADLTREDIDYLGSAAITIHEAVEDELSVRGLYGISVGEGDQAGILNPVGTVGRWSCG